MAGSELWRERTNSLDARAKVRVARVAGRQQGRITDAQLRRLGVSRSQARYWTETGYLHPRLPGVHAVGSPARSTESDLFEAILYAGPGAMVSHGTAAHWYGIADRPPRLIHVSTPRRRRSRPGTIVVHGRRDLYRATHRGIPITTIPQTVLDLAAAHRNDPTKVLRALSILDYRKRLDLGALQRICHRGQPGSAALKSAIKEYDPLFAKTKSDAEIDWIMICKRTGTPLPDATNAIVHGIECDNVYYDARLVVEIDGPGNHRSSAQVHRDRTNDFKLRSHGWLVLRYSTDQLRTMPEAAAAEARAQIEERATKLGARRDPSQSPNAL